MLVTATFLVGAAPTSATVPSSVSLSPASGLASGDIVEARLAGFQPGQPVYGVQCDSRVLTSGDSGFCDSENVTVLVPDSAGEAAAEVLVRAGEDFESANGEGVCDATSACVIAFQQPTESGALAAVGDISFGLRSWTLVEAPARVTAKKASVGISILARAELLPTGTVHVTEKGRLLREATVGPDGTVDVNLRLPAGRHRLEVAYLGDQNFLPSDDDLRIKVVR